MERALRINSVLAIPSLAVSIAALFWLGRADIALRTTSARLGWTLTFACCLGLLVSSWEAIRSYSAARWSWELAWVYAILLCAAVILIFFGHGFREGVAGDLFLGAVVGLRFYKRRPVHPADSALPTLRVR